MDCYFLNERTYKNIDNFLDQADVTENLPDITYYKSHYSPATLINDWEERRVTAKLQKASCEPPLSEHMDQYRKFCTYEVPEKNEYFNHIFDNYGLGKELLLDHQGTAFYDNYTSTNDLFYNHLKKGLCGPFPRRCFKGKYLPETDISLIYGNLTEWGLGKEAKKQVNWLDCPDKPAISETTAQFIAHDLCLVKRINDFPKFKRIKVTFD